MKTLTLWTILLFLFASCSADNQTDISEASQSVLTDSAVQNKMGLYPENSANVFDFAGKLYYEISDSYLAGKNAATTTAEIILKVEALANSDEEFKTLRPATYTSPSVWRIDSILNNQQVAATNVILNSDLSTKAKTSFTFFLNTLMLNSKQNASYEDIYQFIVDYEDDMISNSGFTYNDKRMILTTTSITRHGFYFAKKQKRKPRDRDWEISWGHIIAGIEGSEESTAKAIVMTVVCGLLHNQ